MLQNAMVVGLGSGSGWQRRRRRGRFQWRGKGEIRPRPPSLPLSMFSCCNFQTCSLPPFSLLLSAIAVMPGLPTSAAWHRWPPLSAGRRRPRSLLISGRGLFRCSVPICPPLSSPSPLSVASLFSASFQERPRLTDLQSGGSRSQTSTPTPTLFKDT